MKRYLPLLFIALASVAVNAQQLPLYTQYIFNPYMVNPAMVAPTGNTEINALYRNQWTGFENAPKTLQFDVQLPLNNKMAVGVNVGNDKTVLLDATSVLFTYGYRVSLATDHVLGFGLSAGVFTNKVNLAGLPATDASDPALTSTKLNNSAIDGQFGVHYTFRNFSLGVSMVNLFERKALSPESFQTIRLSQLKNDIIFATYRAEIIPNLLAIRPSFSYRLQENQPSFYEGSALLSYKDILDIGGGYRQNFGPTAMVRVSIKNISAGFSYDFPSPNAQVSTGGSHEIQLKWRFGEVEKKSSTRTAPAPVTQTLEETPTQQKEESTPPKEESKPQQEPVQNANEPAVKEETKTTPPVEQPKQEPVVQKQEPVIETKKEPVVETKKEPVVQTPVVEKPVEKKEEPAAGGFFYLIINTFEDRANAEAFYNEVVKKGLKAEIKETKIGDVPHYYYVHLPAYKSKEISVEKVIEVQKKTGFKDAWYKQID